jgi:hypothetical protein
MALRAQRATVALDTRLDTHPLLFQGRSDSSFSAGVSATTAVAKKAAAITEQVNPESFIAEKNEFSKHTDAPRATDADPLTHWQTRRRT